ncbi:MAG: hypothetical protein EA425_04460 [Puniceicoccaceae bacterium]|nr:MAG: hypothetical protein EA425_04460 [Puniceicoccaceae bacterium]
MIGGGFSMRLGKVEFSRWKNLPSLRLDLQPRILLVGPNASGKSNFLDVFRFMHEVCRPAGGLLPALANRLGLAGVRQRPTRTNAPLQLHFAFEDEARTRWHYELGMHAKGGPRSPRTEVAYERVLRNNRLLLNRPDAADHRDPERLSVTCLESPLANASFRPIRDFFASTGYCQPAGKLAAAEGSDAASEAIVSLLNGLPKRLRTVRLRQLESVLKSAVPRFQRLELSDASAPRPKVEAHFAVGKAGSMRASSDELSEGTYRLLHLISSVLAPHQLLLVEEPEAALGPAVIRHLAGIFHRLGGDTQIMLSSHSAELLADSGIDASEVVLFLPQSGGEARVVVAGEIPEIKALLEEGLSVGEVVLPRTAPSRLQELGLIP